MTYGRCKFIKDWPEWDSAIHADDAQIERQGRAMTYHFTFDVNGLTGTGRFSSTSDLPYYDTSLSQCTCHDFQNRHLPCKHTILSSMQADGYEIIDVKVVPLNRDKTMLDMQGYSTLVTYK